MTTPHPNDQADDPKPSRNRGGFWLGRALVQVPASIAILLVRGYQHTLSPVLPMMLGPGCGCRFHPSCSRYAVDAFREHGFCVGICLALWRLLRCHPWSSGGHDPVIPRCTRTRSAAV